MQVWLNDVIGFGLSFWRWTGQAPRPRRVTPRKKMQPAEWWFSARTRTPVRPVDEIAVSSSEKAGLDTRRSIAELNGPADLVRFSTADAMRCHRCHGAELAPASSRSGIAAHPQLASATEMDRSAATEVVESILVTLVHFTDSRCAHRLARCRAPATSAPPCGRILDAVPSPSRRKTTPARRLRRSGRPSTGSPDGIRTRATALRGRRARPLHNGARWSESTG